MALLAQGTAVAVKKKSKAEEDARVWNQNLIIVYYFKVEYFL